MAKSSAGTRNITAARRGQILQRVLVDGWSPGQAAAFYGIPERQVARWVAAYRRFGMASLRDEAALDAAPRRWLRRVRAALAHARAVLGIGVEPRAKPCVVLAAAPPDRHPAIGPNRRSLLELQR